MKAADLMMSSLSRLAVTINKFLLRGCLHFISQMSKYRGFWKHYEESNSRVPKNNRYADSGMCQSLSRAEIQSKFGSYDTNGPVLSVFTTSSFSL